MIENPTVALLEMADSILELAGALIDLQPPATQDQLASIQLRMLELKKRLQGVESIPLA